MSEAILVATGNGLSRVPWELSAKSPATTSSRGMCDPAGADQRSEELLGKAWNARPGAGVSLHVRSSDRRKHISVTVAIAAALTVGVLANRVLFSFGCRFTPESESESTARVLRDAIKTWRAVTGVTTCPTIADLKRAKMLNPGTPARDAWGNSFQGQCSTVGVRVSSAGRDLQRGSEDDIVVPKLAQ
jgi:hypothetical protein